MKKNYDALDLIAALQEMITKTKDMESLQDKVQQLSSMQWAKMNPGQTQGKAKGSAKCKAKAKPKA